MKKIDAINIQWVAEKYGDDFFNGKYILGIDYDRENNGAEIVIYEVQDFDGITTQKELNEWCDENGGDEESYEIDRITHIRVDSPEDKYINNHKYLNNQIN